MTEITIQCGLPDCKKKLEVSEDMKYCPYCGTSFELYGIKTNDLFILKRDYEKLKDKRTNQSLGLFFLLLLVTASFFKSFFNIPLDIISLISMCLAIGPSLLIFLRHEKELRRKFPQFYEP